MIQKTNSNCYYTLSASTLARFPKARGRFESRVENCTNIVNFFDSSYVYLVNQYTKDTVLSDEPVQTVFWDFGDGESSNEFNPTHIFPEKGGKYTVTLTASMANGACNDVTTFDLDLPESDDYETIAGLITFYNEAIPKEKEILQFGLFSFQILKTNKKRIETVNLKVLGK